ncbi:MAG: 16S rRNA (adenine(1518)-N(6)/adenine(1519)-N(6))-dimethyltransferase [Gammaproteobacteria bacterium]|nr:MAG: 16S rRNA (adenine(1518)-N(6)/adenine(1519)-N(6))-dimethyltransferase [Gammaproteobacteria bacterium]
MGKSLNHKARKRFGQNFLHDSNVIERIISSIAATSKQHIVEIGPGKGALTEHLVNMAGRLDVIELDRDLIPILEQRFSANEHFSIHNIDALKFDFSTLIESETGKLRLVGNLPYNISTPLIFHLLDNVSIVEDMHFMLQKEVVERLTASPDTKAYGRLSILVQYLCHAEQLFIVPPGAFNPVPKVDSAIVQLTPRNQRQKGEQLCNADIKDLSFIAKTAFAQRRKTLRNNLKKILTAEQIAQCAIDPGRRAETLAISEFVALTNRYVQTLDI